MCSQTCLPSGEAEAISREEAIGERSTKALTPGRAITRNGRTMERVDHGSREEKPLHGATCPEDPVVPIELLKLP